MMKMKDFICLFAGIALLALAFLIKGYGEEAVVRSAKSGAKAKTVQTYYSDYPLTQFCGENRENSTVISDPVFLKIK